MTPLSCLFSPRGSLTPQPFVYGAIAVYLAGLGSHLLTTPAVLGRGGLWPFIAVQIGLLWIWYVLHVRRLHDAARGDGLAAAVALLYGLSVLLLLLLADSFFNTSDAPMGDANAASALWIILVLYMMTILAGAPQYDLAWAVVGILTVMAFVPIAVALVFTVWTATRPRPPDAAAW